MLLDYLYTNPNARLRFMKSDMQLHVDSDAAYLIAPKAKSRAAGYYHLSNKDTNNIKMNAPIHVECILLKHVVTSKVEAETAALFHKGQTAIGIKKILHALDHQQRTNYQNR